MISRKLLNYLLSKNSIPFSAEGFNNYVDSDEPLIISKVTNSKQDSFMHLMPIDEDKTVSSSRNIETNATCDLYNRIKHIFQKKIIYVHLIPFSNSVK